MIFAALVAVAAFLLGLRLGLALGHTNERRRAAKLALADKSRRDRALPRGG